jgi:hypothetical protein
MNKKLKNVVTTFEKTLIVIFSIEDSHAKRRSSYICKQAEIKRDIKKDDKNADVFGGNPNLIV